MPEETTVQTHRRTRYGGASTRRTQRRAAAKESSASPPSSGSDDGADAYLSTSRPPVDRSSRVLRSHSSLPTVSTAVRDFTPAQQSLAGALRRDALMAAATKKSKASLAPIDTAVATLVPTPRSSASLIVPPTPTDAKSSVDGRELASPTPFGQVNGKPIPAALAAWPYERFFQRYRLSLIPAIEHDFSLLAFLRSPVNQGMITYLSQKTSEVIDVPLAPPSPGRALHTPPATPARNGFDGCSPIEVPSEAATTLARNREQLAMLRIPPLEIFITGIVIQSHVATQTLMTTLIYLGRLKEKLPRLSRGMHCTRHRVFLAALIVASKYLNDQSPKNKHWSKAAGKLFSVAEINLMESQLLGLLNWNLAFTEEELKQHLSPFLHAYAAVHKPSSPLPSPSIMLHPASAAGVPISLSADKIGGSPNSSFPTPPVTPMAPNQTSKQSRDITPPHSVPTLQPLSWPSTGSSSASSSGPVTPATNSSLLHARRAAKRLASAIDNPDADDAMRVDEATHQFESRTTAEVFNKLVRAAMGQARGIDVDDEVVA